LRIKAAASFGIAYIALAVLSLETVLISGARQKQREKDERDRIAI